MNNPYPPPRCTICDNPLPQDREDIICESCRQDRILLRRSERQKAVLAEPPIYFGITYNLNKERTA